MSLASLLCFLLGLVFVGKSCWLIWALHSLIVVRQEHYWVEYLMLAQANPTFRWNQYFLSETNRDKHSTYLPLRRRKKVLTFDTSPSLDSSSLVGSKGSGSGSSSSLKWPRFLYEGCAEESHTLNLPPFPLASLIINFTSSLPSRWPYSLSALVWLNCTSILVLT